MTTVPFDIASKVITENEFKRIACLYLYSNLETNQINWEKATEQFGSASANSMRVSMRNIMNKIEKASAAAAAAAGQEAGEHGEPAGNNDQVLTPPASNKKAGNKRGRPSKANKDGEEGGDGEGEKQAPAKKKGRKTKAQKEAEAAEAAKKAVKNEEED